MGNKGGSMEREVATKLSLWWSEGASDDLFWRSQASGGRATVRGKRGKANPDQFGDIVATGGDASLLMSKWSIEVKTGYASKNKDKKITNWCILDTVDSKQKESVIEKFWKQCSRDAELSSREPVLIFRRPLMSVCICMDNLYFNSLVDHFGACDSSRLRVTIPNVGQLVILKLEDFFTWIPNIRSALL